MRVFIRERILFIGERPAISRTRAEIAGNIDLVGGRKGNSFLFYLSPAVRGAKKY